MNENLSENNIDSTTNAGFDVPSAVVDATLEPFNEAILTEFPMPEEIMQELLNEAEALEIEPIENFEASPDSFDVPDEFPINFDAVFEGLDEYDFDGKDINRDSERLGGLLDGFKESNWAEMDLSEQKEQITGLFDYVNEVLGLDTPPNIEYYQGEYGEYGGYDSSTNTLSINENMLHEADEAADTVAHELWHTYQHERALNPKSPKDHMYQFGFDNYIRPGDDFDAYQSQLVEAEARAFANEFKGRISA